MPEDGPTGAADKNQPPNSSKSALDRAIEGFVTVVMSLPVAIRTLILLVLLGLGAAYVYLKFTPPKETSTNPSVTKTPAGSPIAISIASGTQVYINGVADPNHPGADNDNPQNKEADHKAAEDDKAVQWHFNHSEDSPPEVSIGPEGDPQTFLHYRFYEKSDRCLFVHRKDKTHDSRQWVRDPNFHEHDLDAQNSQSSLLETPERLAIPLGNIVPAAFAVTPPGATPKPQPMQANNCVNPHPGSFKFWWGQPADKCNSPMYRQFGDGCIHYQTYNRCANSWDGRIFWTACHPPPHH
jgi:hypothetical protein